MSDVFLGDRGASEFLTGAGHLYLVRRSGATTTNQDLVISGGPNTNFTSFFVDAGEALGTTRDRYADSDDPVIRHERLVGGASVGWDTMVLYAEGIKNSYNYELPILMNEDLHVANSNAVIFSVLNSIKVDVRSILNSDPLEYYTAGFPGAEQSLSYEGSATLLGSGSGPDPERIVASSSLGAGVAILGRDGIDDYLIGTIHPDAFYGEQDGGPGTTVDTVSYEPAPDPQAPGAPNPSTTAVTATLRDDATGVGFDGAAGDTYLGVENLVGSAFGDTLREEYEGENRLAGGASGDRLTSTAGDDELDGGAGDDLLVSESSGATTFVFGRGYGHDVVMNLFSLNGIRDTTDDEVYSVNLGPADIEIWQDSLQVPFGFVSGESNGAVRVKSTGIAQDPWPAAN